MDRIDERLDRVEAQLARLIDEQARMSTQIAVLIERLTSHCEREDIHTIPPCEPSRLAIAELREEIRASRKWLVGAMSSAILTLAGAVWWFFQQHISGGK